MYPAEPSEKETSRVLRKPSGVIEGILEVLEISPLSGENRSLWRWTELTLFQTRERSLPIHHHTLSSTTEDLEAPLVEVTICQQ